MFPLLLFLRAKQNPRNASKILCANEMDRESAAVLLQSVARCSLTRSLVFNASVREFEEIKESVNSSLRKTGGGCKKEFYRLPAFPRATLVGVSLGGEETVRKEIKVESSSLELEGEVEGEEREEEGDYISEDEIRRDVLKQRERKIHEDSKDNDSDNNNNSESKDDNKNENCKEDTDESDNDKNRSSLSDNRTLNMSLSTLGWDGIVEKGDGGEGNSILSAQEEERQQMQELPQRSESPVSLPLLQNESENIQVKPDEYVLPNTLTELERERDYVKQMISRRVEYLKQMHLQVQKGALDCGGGS